MLDHNLLFSDAQVIADDAWCTNALHIGKTPAEGVWVEVVFTAIADGVKTCKATVYGSDTDAGWAITKPELGAQHTLQAAIGRQWFKFQSKQEWAKVYYECSAAGAFTITCGIVSGPGQDALV